MVEIVKVVNTLIKKHKTNNPFLLCDILNIFVRYRYMKNIRGIYQCDFRQKIIHINNSLDPCMQCQVCAHELGHALLHKKTNTIFMDRHTYILTNKFEIEANMFAAELLVSNESIIEYKDYPISHVASILGIEEMLVEYKINLMKNEFYI